MYACFECWPPYIFEYQDDPDIVDGVIDNEIDELDDIDTAIVEIGDGNSEEEESHGWNVM